MPGSGRSSENESQQMENLPFLEYAFPNLHSRLGSGGEDAVPNNSARFRRQPISSTVFPTRWPQVTAKSGAFPT